MQPSAVRRERVAPSAGVESAVAALLVGEHDRDAALVAIPRPEIHVVVRFGPSTRGGLDAHAMGVRRTVHRKTIRGGHRTVTARLALGAHEAVLGVSASALAERIVPLEDLWGEAATRRLFDRLAAARDTSAAAAVLERELAERLASTAARRTQIVRAAADRLASASVSAVAGELGISERNLRRVFRETVGVSPKTYAKLTRFHRALHAARDDERASWARIAAAAGYYDQAHLIAEFRTIAGVTPRVLIAELRGAWGAEAHRASRRAGHADR